MPARGLRICGPNGSGKTSVLEAVSLLAMGRSHRRCRDRDVATQGKGPFCIQGRIQPAQGLPHELELAWSPAKKSASVDRQILPRISALFGHLFVVVIDTDCINLVRGTPADRRAFLDFTLSALEPPYFRLLLDYRRAMKRRNAALATATSADIEAWSLQLAHLGSRLSNIRAQLVPKLTDRAQRVHRDLSGTSLPLHLQLRHSLPLDVSKATEVLIQHTATDRRLGHTSLGPHRDNLLVDLGAQAARNRTSLGEAKSLGQALLAAQSQLIAEARNDPPLLLLDDLSGELDSSRIERLAALLPPQAQALVTDSQSSSLPPPFAALEPLHLQPS